MKLVIAEKPSVARSIGEVLGATKKEAGFLSGDGYYVSWCVGHLVGLCEAGAYDEKYKKWQYDDLPILPEPWKHKVLESTKGQYQTLKKLLLSDEVEEVICATDAGREGELIFRLVYEQAKCLKPVKRLWISSMENSAIKQGFESLRDIKEYDNLYQSALCRARADWLVGINGTRLFTTLYNHKLPVGRVQTPTLSMLVERETQISNFKKEPFYLVHLKTDNIDAISKRFKKREEAEKLLRACQEEGQALVVSVAKEKKSKAAPKLYDLTTLQREANRLFGYTAQQTLDLAQALYEKKLITYPRTDSRYLTEDMRSSAARIVLVVKERFLYARDIESDMDIAKVLNNKKVSDHHAIIPTAELQGASIDSMPESEKKLLALIGYKLLAAISPKLEYWLTKINLTCGGGNFAINGRNIERAGFTEIEDKFKQSMKIKQVDKQDIPLPDIEEGMKFDAMKSEISNHETTPPKHFAEDTLLLAMERAGNEDMSDEVERKGLGTPATRAAIIEKLIRAGLVERKGKLLLPTEDGNKLITILPEQVKSAKLTAKWEMELVEVAKGKATPEDFMRNISHMVTSLVQTYHEVSEEEKTRFAQEKKVLGKCPRCGNDVTEIQNGYVCEGGKDCGFALWKNNKFFKTSKKSLTPKIVEEILKNGKAKVTGLYSPKLDKKYTAYLLFDDTGEFINFKLEFPRKKEEEKKIDEN